MSQKAQYVMESTRQVDQFLDAVNEAGQSASGGAAILDAIKNNPGVTVPGQLNTLLGMVPTQREGVILDAIATGVSEFTARNGAAPTADVVEAAIQQGLSARLGISNSGQILDGVAASASSTNSASTALQSNRAVVAILSAIAEAIPFASYLPVDLGSNQAKLAILSHVAGSAYGDYAVGSLMNGTSTGDVYTSSQRMARVTNAAGVMPALPLTTRFSATNLSADPGYCDPASTGVAVLRGRTIVYVNGVPAAMEPTSGNSTLSPLSGSITVGGVASVIAGTVNPATGALVITSITPALPANTEVFAQGFVDYEASPGLIPKVIVRADTWDIYANPWRVMSNITIDANTQLKNELGLDGPSEALMAIRTQMAMERHYLALRYVAALGKNIEVTHDFTFSTERAQKTRAQMWQDFAPTLGMVDQLMANATMDHGVTHLYVGAFVAAQLQSLPSELFVSSGVTARAGIYRVGRLFGKYEVFYSPKVVVEAANQTTSTILAVGRSSQTARCPIVLGDAVAPTFLPLATNADFVNQSGMYARDFTVTNPHAPSALGCARINLINMK